MPAPAVIPAPIAYIIDVAVETFVVELYLLRSFARLVRQENLQQRVR